MTLTIGSLFSGYGGLDLAVEEVFGARTVWHVEHDQNPSKVLAAHWDVPNHSDISTVDWSTVEPVDILCGGFPCQDISSAGLGAGIKEGTRSGLWFRFVDAVRALRPGLVVVENVSALLVRGLDIVLGDLACLGYDARWCCLRASDVGAPHGRRRLFLVAWPAAHPYDGPINRQRSRPLVGRGDQGAVVALLPSPITADAEGGRRVTNLRWEGGTAYRPSGAKASVSLREAIDLLPTPTASDSKAGRGHRYDGTPYGPTSGTTLTDAAVTRIWAQYAAAITRWEHLTRPAPAPLDGKGRLNPLLPEWMMGLPEGWVTDHLGRSAALRCIGNGVVPQQAAAALRLLLGDVHRLHVVGLPERVADDLRRPGCGVDAFGDVLVGVGEGECDVHAADPDARVREVKPLISEGSRDK